MAATYIKKIMHNIIDLCDSGVYSRKICNMFLFSQVYGLVEHFNIGILLRHLKYDKCQTLHDGTAH